MSHFHTFCPLIKDKCKEECMFFRSVTSPYVTKEFNIPKCLIYQALTPMAVKWEEELLSNIKNDEPSKF